MAWLQKKIVLPEALSSKMRSTHFFWKRPSPTASASSRRITSGRTAVATENASRICMPEEYVLTGRSKKSPSSANASISGNAADDLLAREPREGGLQDHVAPARVLRMEGRARARGSRPSAPAGHGARRRGRGSREDLEERALPRAVLADDAEDRAPVDAAGDAAERVDLGVPRPPRQRLDEPVARRRVEPVDLREVREGIRRGSGIGVRC